MKKLLEKVLTGSRVQVYSTFLLALSGLLEAVNPSRAPIWDAFKDIAVILGG